MGSIRWGDVNQIEGARQKTTPRDIAVVISFHVRWVGRIPISSIKKEMP